MNILGINPFHNGSICILSDGDIVYYIEEERLTKTKYDELPFKSILNILPKYPIDFIAIGGANNTRVISKFFGKEILSSFLEKLNFNTNQIQYFDNNHHTTHISTAFYNSGFKEAIGIIVDGGGSTSIIPPYKIEADSIFYCSYPSTFNLLYQNSYPVPISPTEPLAIGKCFEQLCTQFNFGPLDGGKIMGLSSYGNPLNNLPSIFKKNKTNPNIINFKKLYTDFFSNGYSTEWHYNESKITNLEKDLAWKLQTESQNILGNYIEETIQETKLNNVVVAGGYGLNCVANYYLKKRFPKVNFYFEPISHDGGTAIGTAKLLWHQKTQDTTIRPLKSLYLGKQYSKEELLEGIKKYVDTPQ